MKSIKIIGILGSGTMGLKLSVVFASYGYDVIIWDRHEGSKNLYERLCKEIDYNIHIKYSKRLNKEEVLSSIARVNDIKKLSRCDLVLEAVKEEIKLKKALFNKISKIVSISCILASNTSSLKLSDIAKAAQNPERVVGLHFMNPPLPIKAVELIVTPHSSAETIQKTKYMLQRIGKTVIVLDDLQGGVINRLLLPIINEAVSLFQTTGIPPREIDKVWILATGAAMGPLKLADYIGLDICVEILNNLYKATRNTMYMPNMYLKSLVSKGFLGRKTGKGFYIYNRI